MRFLVKHFGKDQPVPPCVDKATFLVVDKNAVDEGALDVAPERGKCLVACHLGGFRYSNSWDGPEIFDGPGIARNNEGEPLYHGGYGPNFRLVDFRCETPQLLSTGIVARIRRWKEEVQKPRHGRLDAIFNDEMGPWFPGLGVGWEVGLFRSEPSEPEWGRPLKAEMPDVARFDSWAVNALNEARIATGKLIVSNCDGYNIYSRFGGAMLEGAFHWLGAPDNTRITPGMWDRQAAALGTLHGSGHVLVLSESKGDGDWRGRLRFALASTKLASHGANRIHFGFIARRQFSGRSEWHEQEFSAIDALGSPTAPKQYIRDPRSGAATAWRREFEGGTVAVNPSGANITSPQWNLMGRVWGEPSPRGIQMVKAGEGLVVLR